MKKSGIHPLVAIFLAGLACLAAFIAGYALRSSLSRNTEPVFPLVLEADELIQEFFAGELPDQQSRQYGMIEGLVHRLGDPHSGFFEPVAHELQMDSLSGAYGGIGVHLTVDERGSVLLNPYPESPAFRSGIRSGDVLLSIDGESIGDFDNIDHILATLHGPVGTTVTLTLNRQPPVAQRLELEVEREVINAPSVTSSIVSEAPSIGVIKINSITDRTANEVEQAFSHLLELGMEALILDLRANPGGILDEAVDIARFFLAEGIVLIDRRNGQADLVYRVEVAGQGSDIPMVLLVDGGTASAAEAIAAAIQANSRAPLFGSRTFGKGSVQIVLELSDGSSLHITNSHWYTPTGETYNGAGLTPNFQIDSNDDEKDPALLAGIRHLSDQGVSDP